MSHPIEAEGLVRRFGDLTAVAGVDLVVEQGEIFGFLGPNGAGKSTLVRMLTTLLRPTAGGPGWPATTWWPRRARCAARSASPCRTPPSTR